MEPAIRVTVAGATTESPGPGGWSALVRIPGRHPARVSGSEHGATPGGMRLTALQSGLRMAGAVTGGGADRTALEIRTDSAKLLEDLDRWVRTGEAEGPAWKEIQGMNLGNYRFRGRLIDQVQRDSELEECLDRARMEAALAASHPGAGLVRVVETVLDEADGRTGEEFLRGYRAGYQAAKTDMANQLNRIRPLLLNEPEGADDLPF